MGGFHVGFLIWDELEKIGGRKMGENAKKSSISGQKPVGRTSTEGVVPVPGCSGQSVPVPLKSVPVPTGSG